MIEDLVLVDVELADNPDDVGGWGEAIRGKARIACAVTLAYRAGSLRVWDGYPAVTAELVSYLNRFATVGGFNIDAFDCPVIHHIGGKPVTRPTYDLLREIKKVAGGTFKGWSLGAVLEGTLHHQKCDGIDGADIPRYWKAGRYGLVMDHCVQDVVAVRDLIDWIGAGAVVSNGVGSVYVSGPPPPVGSGAARIGNDVDARPRRS